MKNIRKIISLILAFVIFVVGCGQKQLQTQEADVSLNQISVTEESIVVDLNEELGDADLDFDSLDDEELLQYVEDKVYEELSLSLDSDDYIIEDISAVYISKEYLEELAYNSQENIFYGYRLSDVDAVFDGDKYVFTCSEDGETIVTEYVIYEDTFEQILKNVAIGAGVIIICVTVTIVAGAAGATTVSAVFAASAKTGTVVALSSGAISGASTAVITGIETHDVNKTLKEAALAASEDFKWGAITGVVTGGASKAIQLNRAGKAISGIPKPRESELYVLEQTGGEEQVSFLAGERVAQSEAGATRPDIVIQKANGAVEAIEVKNYDLSRAQNRSNLLHELKRQVGDRIVNLPNGSTQKIYLDTRGRGYSKQFKKEVKKYLQDGLSDIYPNIPIVIL